MEMNAAASNDEKIAKRQKIRDENKLLSTVYACCQCGEKPDGKMTQCVNGHLTCPDCVEISPRCCKCNMKAGDIPNFAVDARWAASKLMCPNQECMLTFNSIDDLNTHTAYCTYNDFECRVCNKFEGSDVEMANHYGCNDCTETSGGLATFTTRAKAIFTKEKNVDTYYIIDKKDDVPPIVVQFHVNAKGDAILSSKMMTHKWADTTKVKVEISVESKKFDASVSIKTKPGVWVCEWPTLHEAEWRALKMSKDILERMDDWSINVQIYK